MIISNYQYDIQQNVIWDQFAKEINLIFTHTSIINFWRLVKNNETPG